MCVTNLDCVEILVPQMKPGSWREQEAQKVWTCWRLTFPRGVRKHCPKTTSQVSFLASLPMAVSPFYLLHIPKPDPHVTGPLPGCNEEGVRLKPFRGFPAVDWSFSPCGGRWSLQQGSQLSIQLFSTPKCKTRSFQMFLGLGPFRHMSLARPFVVKQSQRRADCRGK